MGRCSARTCTATTAPPAPVTGTSFAVWAPHAQGVRVKGDFNSWDGREHPMRAARRRPGVWELFVPGVGAGTRYKFVVLGADGEWREKADPMAFRTEVPAGDARRSSSSRATSGATTTWMAARREREPRTTRPMSIYEVHLGSWRHAAGPTRELADELVGYVARPRLHPRRAACR